MTQLFISLSAFVLTMGFMAPASAAPNLDLYHRLVDIQRDNSGKLTQLLLKPADSLKGASTSEPVDVIAALRGHLEKRNAVPGLTAADRQNLTNAGWTTEDIKNYDDARELLSSSQEAQRLLNDKIVDKILREFQKDLNVIFQFNVLAKPGIPGYFHDRALIDKALKKALSAAEDAFGASPAVKAVEFLLNTTLGWVEEKRSYCQNVLLFYIEKTPAASLGFSDEEIAFIKSSIFERQIAWWDLQKLEVVKKHWATYGPEQFSKQISNNDSRLATYGAAHGEILSSLSFAFTFAQKNNVSYILNTQNQQSKISKDLSIAYDGSAPQHIRNFRIELQLTQLATSLLPIPSFALSQLNSLIGSYYADQKVTEGALYASLASSGNTALARTILEQSINPILIHDLK